MIRVTGSAILSALENSVSTYPALEGRFPQVSNITFEFDPNLPPNHRVKYVKIGNDALDHDRKYVLVTRDYMARGKDGFDSLRTVSEGGEAEEIVSEENGILISMMLRQYFMSLKTMGKWRNWGQNMERHWNGVQHELREKHPIISPATPSGQTADIASRTEPLQEQAGRANSDESSGDEYSSTESEDDSHHHKPDKESLAKRERELQIMRKVMGKWWRLAKLPGQPKVCDTMDEGEFKVHWTRAICPRLEGRIRMTSPAK